MHILVILSIKIRNSRTQLYRFDDVFVIYDCSIISAMLCIKQLLLLLSTFESINMRGENICNKQRRMTVNAVMNVVIFTKFTDNINFVINKAPISPHHEARNNCENILFERFEIEFRHVAWHSSLLRMYTIVYLCTYMYTYVCISWKPSAVITMV